MRKLNERHGGNATFALFALIAALTITSTMDYQDQQAQEMQAQEMQTMYVNGEPELLPGCPVCHQRGRYKMPGLKK